MGYWYANTDERTESWHWVGVAIGLSQTLGFHRDPRVSNVPVAQRRLWRRIWWCCFYRDRFLALGMGRPTRINLEDCDVPDLLLADLVSTQSSSELSTGAACMVQKCHELSETFLEMLQLCKIIGRVLASQYRPGRSTALITNLQHLESELQSWYSRQRRPPRLDGILMTSVVPSTATYIAENFLHLTYQ